MDISKFLTATAVFGLALVAPQKSRADFGEIDLLVRDSIATHFTENSQVVDLQSLIYTLGPRLDGSTLEIHSSVWTQPSHLRYECTTEIEILARGVYSDRGSICTSGQN